MKTINKPSLVCLYFNAKGHVADWNVLPHPEIWGSDPRFLPATLALCPDPDLFSATLLATHLLFSRSTPPWAYPWLVQKAPEILAVDLSVLEAFSWRLVSLPVAAESRVQLCVCLIATGPEQPAWTPWNNGILAQDSYQALEIVQTLVHARTKQHMGYFILAPGKKGMLIQGESLGLPCFLGAMAAAENLDTSFWLATGRVDQDGQVLAVENVQQKLTLALEETRVFLYPRHSAPLCSHKVECVPVTHVRQALGVLACYQPGLALKIASAEQALEQKTSIALEIRSFDVQMVPWIERNRTQIAQALSADPGLQSLLPDLSQWTDATRQAQIQLGNAVLSCFCIDQLKEQNWSPYVVWQICQLQMRKANHCGQLDTFDQWKSMARDMRAHISPLPDGDHELVVDGLVELIGARHNCYNFSEPWLDDTVQQTIVYFKEQHQARCRLLGPGAHLTLGKYYGTMGQHYGFCGPHYLNQALECLDQAIACFCGNDAALSKERNRDRVYKVFALSSAGKTDDAENILQVLPGLWSAHGWQVEQMDFYQLHALLRLYVDSGRTMPPRLWNAIRFAWSTGAQVHPRQLIAYNLGLLAPDPKQAEELFLHSLNLCLSPESGPTIQAMALLPLAQLHECGQQKNWSDYVARAMQPIKENKLSVRHFYAVREGQGWEDVLRQVVKNKNKLFPYSYR